MALFLVTTTFLTLNDIETTISYIVCFLSTSNFSSSIYFFLLLWLPVMSQGDKVLNKGVYLLIYCPVLWKRFREEGATSGKMILCMYIGVSCRKYSNALFYCYCFVCMLEGLIFIIVCRCYFLPQSCRTWLSSQEGKMITKNYYTGVDMNWVDWLCSVSN